MFQSMHVQYEYSMTQLLESRAFCSSVPSIYLQCSAECFSSCDKKDECYSDSVVFCLTLTLIFAEHATRNQVLEIWYQATSGTIYLDDRGDRKRNVVVDKH
jgi:hypothetical protein